MLGTHTGDVRPEPESLLADRPMHVESIDVFVTFKCGLRCSHCFVGSNLESNRDMDFASLDALIRAAHLWGTKHITFLGGEPTMYPRLGEALRLCSTEGYSTRIVTNGHHSYQRFLRSKCDVRPFVCFSVDGASAAVHDSIRGAGSFAVLSESIGLTKAAGYRIGAIVAVCRENVGELADIIALCQRHGCEYVNIHYVTNRGFAQAGSVLTMSEWQKALAIVRQLSGRAGTRLRIERTFLDAADPGFSCAVANRSNLMFLPDGRVYMCMMFIDAPNAHSFMWVGGELRPNPLASAETQFVRASSQPGCAAMRLVNPVIAEDAAKEERIIQCIYEKDTM